MVVTLDSVTPDDKKHLGLFGIMNVDMDSPVTKSLMRKSVDGLTAAEIAAKADSIRAVNEEAKKARKAEEEEKAAAEKKMAAEAHAEYERRLGQNVLFRASNFRIAKNEWRSQAQVDVQVSNQSGTPIAGLTFSAQMRTPGRAIPWHREDSQQAWFDGGIENDEVREETAVLDSSWKYKDFPNDAIFEANLLCVYGPVSDGLHHPLFTPPDGVCNNIRESY